MPFRHFQLLLCCLALAAAGVVLLATRHGVGVSPDSATYIAGARQLSHGHGLTTPQGGEAITHFPPLFPAIIAAPGFVGVDAIPAARGLNLLLWAVTVYLAGMIAYRSAGGSAGAGLTCAALVATSVDLLNVHAWAWSEPLLICCGLAGLWLLQRYLWETSAGIDARCSDSAYEAPSATGAASAADGLPARGTTNTPLTRRRLIIAAGLIAAAVLARYAGAAVVATAGLGLLLRAGVPLGRRCAEIVLFLLIALAPIAGWMVRNKLVAANATNREAIYHPVTVKQLTKGVTTIAGWVVPDVSTRRGVRTTAERVGLPLTLLVVASLSGVALLARYRSRRWAGGSGPRVPWVIGLFLPVYGLFVLASLSFFDAQIPLDDRMLAPLLAATICFAVPAGAAALGPLRGRVVRGAVAVGCLGLIGWFCFRDANWVRDARRSGLAGQNYSSPEWKRSGVMAAIRELPPDAFIYTNSPGAVLLLANRVCADIPEKTDRNSTLPRKDYEGRMTYMRERLEGGAYLAYFRTVKSRHNLPTEEELRELLPLVEDVAAGDGVIYRMARGTTKP